MRVRATLAITVAVLLGAQAEALERVEQGIREYGAAQYEDAYELFQSVIDDESARPYHAEAWFWRGRAALALERFGESRDAFRRFLEIDPEHPDAHEAEYELARLLLREERYEEALRAFDQFVSQYDDSPFVGNALYWTGEALVRLGRVEAAREAFNTVVTEYPDSYRAAAAEHRRRIIDIERRERELLELLRWSQEELDRERRKSRRLKQSYERELADLRERAENGAPDQQIAELNARIRELEEAKAEAQERVDVLEVELRRVVRDDRQVRLDLISELSEDAVDPPAADLPSELQELRDELERRLELARAKEQALELREEYLEVLIRRQEAEE